MFVLSRKVGEHGKNYVYVSVMNYDTNEKIVAVTTLHRKTTPKFIIFVTKQGMIKKSYLDENNICFIFLQLLFCCLFIYFSTP